MDYYKLAKIKTTFPFRLLSNCLDALTVLMQLFWLLRINQTRPLRGSITIRETRLGTSPQIPPERPYYFFLYPERCFLTVWDMALNKTTSRATDR